MYWYARKKDHPNHHIYKKWFRDYMKERRKGRPDVYDKEDKKAYDQRFKLLKNYGLTLEEYERLLRQTNGICPICQKEFAEKKHKKGCDAKGPVVDHNHETNEVRGIICGMCNIGIGVFYEDQETMIRAIKWLNKGGYFG